MDDDDHACSATPEVLYEGQWLRMCRRGRWEYAERTHGDGMAVIIVAATPDDRVLFVEQPRVPLGARTIEMPAGLVGDQPGEDSLDLQRVGPGGGDESERITVHEVPRAEAPAWLVRKRDEGYEVDLKLWAGLWMLERNPDGSPIS